MSGVSAPGIGGGNLQTTQRTGRLPVKSQMVITPSTVWSALASCAKVAYCLSHRHRGSACEDTHRSVDLERAGRGGDLGERRALREEVQRKRLLAVGCFLSAISETVSVARTRLDSETTDHQEATGRHQLRLHELSVPHGHDSDVALFTNQCERRSTTV